ncbi:MAG: thiol oxidoreductase [Zoogloeaceae bacterium]|nr:thiol oxidoreductase [Zoogloeaceae bacterium]
MKFRSVPLLVLFSACALQASSTALDADEAGRIARVTALTNDFSAAEPFERNPAGAATVNKHLNTSVFSHPSGNMSFERQLDFRVGDGVFRKLWVSAPSSTLSSDGLGPLFNARSCQSCHLKDGRGAPPQGDEAAVSMFLRLSIPPQTDADREALTSRRRSVIPEPTYGGQLQNFSIQGVPAEGRMDIRYDEIPVTLADGEVVHLRKPAYSIADLNYGPLHPQVMLSPRVASPMIGMGLLEAIPEAAILANADPDDANGDGISGRPNFVRSDELGRVALGRFGWKAGKATVADQTAHAFAGDLGISTPLVRASWGDCTEAQTLCREAPHGEDADEGVEATRQMFDLTVFYSRNLAVPARRDVDAPQVLAGKKLFYDSGCVSCHRPKFVTRRDSAEPEQSFQLIWPYTDLLLHDMGEGLADHRPEGDANGREWRTAPLWGLGLTETVSGHTFLLHDGRARNVLEAILWHGGEAQAARDRVVAMRRAEREALLVFLNSL